MKNKHALLLFSGGQDSGTCLAYALENFDTVSTIGFEYGQRHHVEMNCRKKLRENISKLKPQWQNKLGEDIVLNTDFFKYISANALTADMDISTQDETTALPNTFVPGRNLIFLNMAAAFAYGKDIQHIMLGVCEADYSGYPDCRDNTIKAMQVAINTGMDSNFIIHTPLMFLSKAEAWHLAESLGGVDLVNTILEDSHTCYMGDRTKRHPWGYGCNACPACILRAKGFETYQQKRATHV